MAFALGGSTDTGHFHFFSFWLSILAAFRGYCIRRVVMAEVPPDSGETQDLLQRAHAGEPRAFVELFAGYRA